MAGDYMVLVSPEDTLILFNTLTEKLNKLYEWELIAKTHISKISSGIMELKTFRYYYIGIDRTFDECDIVGYVPYRNGKGETAVISIKSNLCKIMPAYLKDMQSPNFEISLNNKEGVDFL